VFIATAHPTDRLPTHHAAAGAGGNHSGDQRHPTLIMVIGSEASLVTSLLRWLVFLSFPHVAFRYHQPLHLFSSGKNASETPEKRRLRYPCKQNRVLLRKSSVVKTLVFLPASPKTKVFTTLDTCTQRELAEGT